MIHSDAHQPVICQSCGLDTMGCAVKRGLGGRRCCADCGHDDDRRDRDMSYATMVKTSYVTSTSDDRRQLAANA